MGPGSSVTVVNGLSAVLLSPSLVHVLCICFDLGLQISLVLSALLSVSCLISQRIWSSSQKYIENNVVVQSLSCVQLFETSWSVAHQASLSFTISQSSLKLMSTESVMLSNQLYCPFRLLPSILPSIRLFSSESAVHIKWPKYWSFSFSVSPSNEY